MTNESPQRAAAGHSHGAVKAAADCHRGTEVGFYQVAVATDI